MGLMSANRPNNMTDRPVFGHRLDPLSEVLGSMRIQDAIYTRLEATAVSESLFGEEGADVEGDGAFILVGRMLEAPGNDTGELLAG